MDERGVILLVKDEQQILDANRRILEGAGHTVLTAATLSDAGIPESRRAGCGGARCHTAGRQRP